MEVLRIVTGMVMMLAIAMAVMFPDVGATRWTVGSNMGWTPNVNYTLGAQDKHFRNGDWLCKFSLSLSLIQIYYLPSVMPS